MLKHYITLALRTLWRNKFHTAINIAGLSVGITACLVIYLIVSFELSFNNNIPDNARIYRVHCKFSPAFAGLNRAIPTAAVGYVKDQVKGIESVSQLFTYSAAVQVPGFAQTKKFDSEEAIGIIAPDYFNVFGGYEWIAGSPDVLERPHQGVLTESQARKYFGQDDPQSYISREIIYNDSITIHVAGILRDLPYRTDMAFTEFISMPTIDASGLKHVYKLNSWSNFNSSTQLFVKTMPGTTHEHLQAQVPLMYKAYTDGSQWKWDALESFEIQPLADLHYNADIGIFDFSTDIAHRPTLVALSGVAILLLVIGAINFINLETAQALRRAKEVGIRKVLGSTRRRLVAQFVSEGVMLTLAATLLALPLTEFSLRAFAEFVPAGVTFDLMALLPALAFIIVFIGVLASSYPAFILSGFLPVAVLKSQTPLGSSNSTYLRKALIVFQFTFAQVLILGTILVGAQIRYMLNKDLGFRKDAIVYFNTPKGETPENVMALKQAVEDIPGVTTTLSEAPPTYQGWNSSMVEYQAGSDKMVVNAFRKFGDENFIGFYDMTLLAGKNLQPSDTLREFIVNETMVKLLGFNSPQEALGARITYYNQKYPIVGVVKDFHTQSLHKAVEPVIMGNSVRTFTCMNVRLDVAGQHGEALEQKLSQVSAAWKKIYPDAPLQYKFLDDTIRSFYLTELRTSKLAYTATGMAIFISCLGLFGLASFTTLQRTREIGIRKILGASVQQIVTLLSKDFIVLVAIAFVLAMPVAWISMHAWLESFSYRITPGVWMFVLTGVLTVVIAFVTVGYQTMKASAKNPVDSLRHE